MTTTSTSPDLAAYARDAQTALDALATQGQALLDHLDADDDGTLDEDAQTARDDLDRLLSQLLAVREESLRDLLDSTQPRD